MHSAYPLLVEQTDWGRGAHSGAGVSSAELLRSIGADLTRRSGQAFGTPSLTALRNVEIVVTEPPLRAPLYAYEYPQPPGEPLGAATRHPSLRVKREPRPTTLNHASPLCNRAGVNRLPQRVDLNPFGVEGFETPPTHRCAPLGGVNSPRSSPHLGRQRTPPLRKEYASVARVPPPIQEESAAALEAREDALRNWPQWGDRAPTGVIGEPGTHSSYALASVRHPNQLVLCCSPPPDLYYSTERLRQEPEPGLCDCCEKKVSCCCACCHTWFPTGNVNSVCTSLICCGIIMFIVLSPLLHYLVPS